MSFCYINGSYKNNIDALISVEDRGFNFSDGVYEVMGFRGGKLLNFEMHLSRLSKSSVQRYLSALPLGFGEPQDVANMVVLLSSHLGKWITGSSLSVDGGYSGIRVS